jgi:hypothetical protein
VSPGKRESEHQRDFRLPTDRVGTGPGHVFYDKLNRLLSERGFDLFLDPCVCRMTTPAAGPRSRRVSIFGRV